MRSEIFPQSSPFSLHTKNSMTYLSSSRPRYRILICVRGNCAEPERGRWLEKRLIQLIAQHGLDETSHPGHTTCTVTNCLAVCHSGPVMIVHPDGIKYQLVDEAALNKIFQQHILGGQPVEELIVRSQPGHVII